MRRVASGLAFVVAVVVAGCSAPAVPRLASDTVLGVRVGLSRRMLRTSFAPRGAGRWYELESVAGEQRLRWAADEGAADVMPQSMDVAIGTDGKVRELVFALRPDDARKLLADLGAAAPSALARYAGPSGDAVVAPGLGSWTLRLFAR